MIKRSKNQEGRPDFDDVMNGVEQEVQADKAEQNLDDRISKIEQLATTVDEVTTAVINAKLTLETAIRQSQREEGKLEAAVTTAKTKVETINNHLDNALKEAPTKLKVSVEVSDADWQKMHQMFDEHNKQILVKMQEHQKEVNAMFANERRKVNERYKEYDGVYLGRYAQWFVGVFFCFGFFGFCGFIAVLIAQHYGKW